MCNADSPTSTCHFGYTPAGAVAYAYDAFGRLGGISYAGGTSVGYGYHRGRLAVIQATISGVTRTVADQFKYSPTGAMTRMVYGNGTVKDREYDLDGRLTITPDHGWLGHTYGYKAHDEVTSIQNWVSPTHNQTFGYDALSRLTSIASPVGNQHFTFDANGNRTFHQWLSNETYTVQPGSNRLLSSDHHFTYDGRGNRRTKSWGGSMATYHYDGFNRLSAVSRDLAVTDTNPNYVTATYPAGTTTYTVNALGQRIAKSGPLGSSRFVYGGQNTLLSEVANGQWTDHIWLGGEPIGFVRSGQLYFTHADRLGRPEVVTDGNASARWNAANQAYDRKVLSSSLGDYNLGFPGQYYDAETGFWYNGFRDYDGRTGGYLQSDPIGLAGGLNTYAYVRGNPISLIDPLGLVDRNYTPTWDGAHGGLALIPSPNGMLTVGVHFNGANFISPSGQAWTPQQLADQIKADADLSQYSSVGLYSCRSGAEGSDGTTPAQALANALGLPVQAATQYTWVINNPIAPYQGNYGKTPTGGVDRSNPGSWINFYPVGP